MIFVSLKLIFLNEKYLVSYPSCEADLLVPAFCKNIKMQSMAGMTEIP